MAPNIVKNSSSCCKGDQTHSPGGLAPRPVAQFAPHLVKAIAKTQAQSRTSTDVHELRAIFKEEIMDKTSVSNPSKNCSEPDDVSDQELSTSEQDLRPDKHPRCSHPLKDVAKKLKKHLSIESALSKRYTRSSIGTSEEEVQRRAELRRIRQRRIQEELSNENGYDDDAKSLSNIMGMISPIETETSLVCLSENFISQVTSGLLEKKFPEALPRDKPWISMGSVDLSGTLATQTGTISLDISPPLLASNSTPSRRHSSPNLFPLFSNVPNSKLYTKSTEVKNIPEILAAAARQPKTGPTECAQIKSPWRLSFVSEHRGEGLRKLSYGNLTATTPGFSGLSVTSKVINEPGESLGLRKHSQKPTTSGEASHSENTNPDLQTQFFSTTNKDTNNVDGAIQILHLRAMGVPQRPASKGLYNSISSPQLSCLGSQQHCISNRTIQVHDVSGDQKFHLLAKDSVALSGRNEDIWNELLLKTPAHERSSRNKRGNKPRFTFVSSPSKINNALGAGEKAVHSEKYEPEDQNTSVEVPDSSNVRSAVEIPSLALPITLLASPSCQEDNESLVVSESSSFWGREEELNGLQIRFASRKLLSTPVSSKFREEFEESDLPARKPSVLARLAKLARGGSVCESRLDGTVDRTDLLKRPLPSFDPAALGDVNSIMTLRSPIDNATATQICVGDLGYTKGNKDGNEGKKGIFGRKKSNAGKTRRTFGIFGRRKKKPSDADEVGQSITGEFIMDSWEMEMEATAARAKTRSKGIAKKPKPKGPDLRFPASWARFPSHNRQQRVYAASAVDKVEVKDFANLGVQENGDILWCLAHDDDGHHTTIDGLHNKKGYRQRFIEKVEKELYEFDTKDDQRAQTNGRRGSLTVSCELEYPELEILPAMFMGGDEIEKHEKKKQEFKLEEMKGKELDQIAKLLGGGFDGVISGAPEVGWSGASDWEDEAVVTSSDVGHRKSQISISDPRYYADCVVTKSTFGSPCISPRGTTALRTDALGKHLHPTRSPEDSPRTRALVEHEKKEKYRTWSGKGWDGYLDGEGGRARVGRKLSLGTVVMRKSTDDLAGELVKREEDERGVLLKAIEDAFGRGGD